MAKKHHKNQRAEAKAAVDAVRQWKYSPTILNGGTGVRHCHGHREFYSREPRYLGLEYYSLCYFEKNRDSPHSLSCFPEREGSAGWQH